MTAIAQDIHELAHMSLEQEFGIGYDVHRVHRIMFAPKQEYTVCGFCGQTGEHEPMCPESEVTA